MGKNTTMWSTLLVAIFWTCGVPAKVASDPEATKYLSFEEVGDGKCHILSEGGKLLVMHNKHPEKPIKFRLTRFFADVRQWGRATGTAVPGEKPTKLGCTQVDGRVQRWEIERANFVAPDQLPK